MRVVCADEEQQDGDGEKELLGRGVLISAVNLFPHVEVVVRSGVEFERHASHPVKHEEGAEHVGDVG